MEKFERFSHKTTVPIIDELGRKIDERTMLNIPFVELFPDEPFVIIDWTANGHKPSTEQLSQPIFYGSEKYYGCFMWGSAVKQGQTIGVTHDILYDVMAIKNVEDCQRAQRWLFANGYYGAGKGELNIKVLPPHTMTRWGLVEDGFGYVSREVVTAMNDPSNLPPVILGKSRDNFSSFQRLKWTEELAQEMTPLIMDKIMDMADPTLMLFSQGASFDRKSELVNLDPIMIEHPYVANALSRACADIYTRLATSIPVNGDYRLAVPTSEPTVCWPGHSGLIVEERYPVDSNGSLQAVDISTSKTEEERISKLEVVQYSLVNDLFHAKGCLGIADGMDCDVILCSEDIKVGKLEEWNILVFVNRWAAGSCAGVNASWAHDLQGLDHDGDGVKLVDCNDMPVYWQAVKDLHFQETPKLKKTKTPILTADNRPQFILRCMGNLVGFATNVTSTTFMVKDREMLSHNLGFSSEVALDKALNFFIKCGTDGLKTQIDMKDIESQLGVLQTNLRKQFGGMAPWTTWPNEFAFRRGIPLVDVELDELDTVNVKNAVKPFMDGTIAEICRLSLPNLQNVLETPIKTRLLTEFRDWAMSVPAVQMECAKVVQVWFNARNKRVNWSDPRSILDFRAEFNIEVQKWVQREQVDPKVAASALWRAAHSARSGDASGASVFIAFPEESNWIVKMKPGLKHGRSTIIVGLNFQLPGLDELDCEVKIIDMAKLQNGKMIVRKAVVAEVEGQIQPVGMPTNVIGVIAANADQPQVGMYIARIHRISSGAWRCELS